MEELQVTRSSSDSLPSLSLLKLMYVEQTARAKSLGQIEQVDWIGLSRQIGINIVEFSF
jgi:hypothetical protein